jgi:hypothetical protein
MEQVVPSLLQLQVQAAASKADLKNYRVERQQWRSTHPTTQLKEFAIYVVAYVWRSLCLNLQSL